MKRDPARSVGSNVSYFRITTNNRMISTRINAMRSSHTRRHRRWHQIGIAPCVEPGGGVTTTTGRPGWPITIDGTPGASPCQSTGIV